jgi:hypothetical protein
MAQSYKQAKKRRSQGCAMDVVDDGLFLPEIGEWGEEKHSVVALYAKLFSTGMKGKWDERVYLELYAGSGFAKIKHTSRIIPVPPSEHFYWSTLSTNTFSVRVHMTSGMRF